MQHISTITYFQTDTFEESRTYMQRFYPNQLAKGFQVADLDDSDIQHIQQVLDESSDEDELILLDV